MGTDPIEVFEVQGIEEDNWQSNGHGSNAIVLPAKKKKNKGACKVSIKSKGKEAPLLSKSKQKKLKQLQEEKERKLLQSKSIRLLEKYKIWDGAYSLLHSSGTIGQAETLREKRRREVQLSKAGLEMPEDSTPFTKKTKKGDQYTENVDEAAMHLASDGAQPCHVAITTDVPLAKCTVTDDIIHTSAPEGHVKAVNKGLVGWDLEPSAESPSLEVTDKDTTPCMSEEQKKIPSISCGLEKETDSNFQDQLIGNSNFDRENNTFPTEAKLQEHVNVRPIVVHVSRPSEVEEKRRDLPIIMMEQEIMEAINEHSIVIICGETGCGKTTQVPQFLYEAGFGSKSCPDKKGIIGVTQPRRVAVLSTAKRVSFELGFRLGKDIGFQVRHDKMIGHNCAIKFMTDGILLREVQSDFLLKKYSIIILDEAHERSLNTDILIGMLSRIIKLRQKLYLEQREKIREGVKIDPENTITQLKLVLMSATLRVEDFISNRKLFHETPPVIEVPVRQYPVAIHFSKSTKQDYLEQAYKKVMSIHKKLPPGGILVFVTGQREVEFLCRKLWKSSRSLSVKNSKGTTENETALSSDFEMRDINEEFEAGGSSDQTDRFSFYENDEPIEDSYSSDSETDSDLGDDSEDEDHMETPKDNNSVLDFLKESESLSYLKASFKALAGDKSNSISEEPTPPVTPLTDGCLEPTARVVGPLHVLPLYAMLPASAQLRVFEEVPEGERLVVVATNVAETSLTIPGIKYVVDTGKEKVKTYNHANGMATYEVQWISKASAAQRTGRAGRTGPGHCYRLYSSAAFSKDDLFPEFSCPEISKTPVDGVVLLMKFMGIDKVVNFPFPTPPHTEALMEAENCLKTLEALDTDARLTIIGKAMAQYPMSPRHSRMLLIIIQIMREQKGYARANLLLGYAVATAAALSFSNPFLMLQGGSYGAKAGMNEEENPDTEKMDRKEKQRLKMEKSMAREARARFCNPSSDALTIAYALQSFELAENPVIFCKENSLHLKTMEDMSKLRKQLLQLVFHHSKFCQEFSWDCGSCEDVEVSWRNGSNKQRLLINEEELLGQAICAGWADRVAKRLRIASESSDKNQKVRASRYQSCSLKDIVFLHRWSSVSQSAPDFLVYTELLCTKRPYMHGVTRVKPDWLVKYVSSLCTFSAPLTDPKPYYEPLSDQVFCWVHPTFGPHNWELPLHSLPIKNKILHVSVFACALLEGQVLPCMRSAQKFLAAPPSTVVRTEALGQRRVGDLLNRLNHRSRVISSRAMLREAWTENPQFLYSEIRQWFQERFHNQFGKLWEQMHHEVSLEGHELFPKRAKKGKRKVNVL